MLFYGDDNDDDRMIDRNNGENECFSFAVSLAWSLKNDNEIYFLLQKQFLSSQFRVLCPARNRDVELHRGQPVPRFRWFSICLIAIIS